jgi:hypothetical protein
MLNAQARHIHVVPGLRGCSLLSITPLWDSGYEVTFDKVIMRIVQNGLCILQGQRNPSNSLWKTDTGGTVTTPSDIHHHRANGVAIGSPTAAELVSYAPATIFSLAVSTVEQALDMGWIHNFPGSTAKTRRQHPPQSIPMVKGHLVQSRKNQRSTKTNPNIITPDPQDPVNREVHLG